MFTKNTAENILFLVQPNIKMACASIVPFAFLFKWKPTKPTTYETDSKMTIENYANNFQMMRQFSIDQTTENEMIRRRKKRRTRSRLNWLNMSTWKSRQIDVCKTQFFNNRADRKEFMFESFDRFLPIYNSTKFRQRQQHQQQRRQQQKNRLFGDSIENNTNDRETEVNNSNFSMRYRIKWSATTECE